MVRGRPNPDRRRGRDRADASGHPGDLAELPAPGHPGQGAHLPRRHLGGRVTLGIGAGGTGFDATALGQEPWTPRERADRLAEFVPLLDRLLTEDAVSYEGDFYQAHEARNIPGCVQRPRLPFAVAATGPRGLRLAARYGQAWVTTGDPRLYEDGTPEQSDQAIRSQADKLTDACAEVGRDVTELDKILLTGFTLTGAARWSPWTPSSTSPAATGSWDSTRSWCTGPSRTPTSRRTRRSLNASRWRPRRSCGEGERAPPLRGGTRSRR